MTRMLLLVLAACVAGCSIDTSPAAPTDSIPPGTPPATAPGVPWPSTPQVPTGALDPEVAAAADRLAETYGPGYLDEAALATVAGSTDARLAWLVADLLSLAPPGDRADALIQAFTALTSTDPRADSRFGDLAWVAAVNLLIGWDLPAPPDYRQRKGAVLLSIEPAWAPFVEDADATIDWRWVSWGGVLIDDRPIADGRPCRGGCIPALDDPGRTPASEGAWYADHRPIFGVVVGDEAVAFPKHIMEVHELVNLTIGGRRIGLPYCTLCASAQAYLVDEVAGVDGPLILRTSGLLSRSNKIMYDLATMSAFNTFTGRATSGPLLDRDVVLEPVTVVATTWGEWKVAHPQTTIVAEDGGIGRDYPDDPLEGRDEVGPIFPIGQADMRLRAQHRIVGAVSPDGPVAFPVDEAIAELESGRPVQHGTVEARTHDGGLRLYIIGGGELATHQAFWFAWSQFHPDTDLWQPGNS